MAKNYFTDAQVREIYYSEAGDSIEIGAFEFYKNLFNKAVEVVIGSAKAQAYVNFEGECEPVGEAIRERDRLGFAVVNVIGKLDEIIENTQEVEIDDFLHIAISIGMWNELEAALEDMPKRADLYTSPQSRECEDWQYFDKAYKKATESSEPDDWMNAALLAQQVRRIQLNTKG